MGSLVLLVEVERVELHGLGAAEGQVGQVAGNAHQVDGQLADLLVLEGAQLKLNENEIGPVALRDFEGRLEVQEERQQ